MPDLDLNAMGLDDKLKLLGQNMPIDQFIPIVAKAYKVPTPVVNIVQGIESGGDQSAVSPKGALGRMQLMPGTAKGLGVNPEVEHENVIGGVKYLAELNKRFEGDWAKTLWGYNAGPGRVDQGVMPAETDEYLSSVRNKLLKYKEEQDQLVNMPAEDKLKLLEQHGVDTTAIRKSLADKAAGFVTTGEGVYAPGVATPGQVAESLRPVEMPSVAYPEGAPEAGLFEATQKGYDVQTPGPLGALELAHKYVSAPVAEKLIPKGVPDITVPFTAGEAAHVNVPSDIPESFVLSKEEQGPPTINYPTRDMMTGGLANLIDIGAASGLTRMLGALAPKSTVPTPAAKLSAAKESELTGLADLVRNKQVAEMTGGGFGTKLESLLEPTWEDIATKAPIVNKPVLPEIAKPPEVVTTHAAETRLADILTEVDRTAPSPVGAEGLKMQLGIEEATGTSLAEVAPLTGKGGKGSFLSKFWTDESGTYNADLMNQKIMEAFKTAIDDPKVASYTAIVNNIASQFKLTPEAVMNTIKMATESELRVAAPIVQNTVRKLVGAVDQQWAPVLEAHSEKFHKSVPSLRNIKMDEVPVINVPAVSGVGTDPTHKAALTWPKSTEITSSPSLVDWNMWRGAENGPVFDYSLVKQRMVLKTAGYRRWNNMMVNELGFAEDSAAAYKAIRQELFPIYSRYFEEAKPALEAAKRIDSLTDELGRVAIGSERANQIQAEIAGLQTVVDMPAPGVGEVIKEIKAKTEELGGRFSSVRIKQATQGKWNGPLTAEEKQVVGNHRGYYDLKYDEMQGQGMPVRDLGRYAPYSYLDAEDMPYFTDKSWWLGNTKPTPTMLKFMSRQSDIDFMPHAFKTFDNYVGAVERKLAINPWLRKWKGPLDRWAATDTATHDFVTSFYNTQNSIQEYDFISKMANAGIDGLYGVLLGFNPSPAILHAFKMVKILAAHGEEAVAYGVGKYAQGTAQRGLGWLGSKLDLPTLAAQASKPEASILEAFIPSRTLIDTLLNDPVASDIMSPNFWKRLMTNPLFSPTRVTEHFGRGVNIFASLYRGEKIAMTPEQLYLAINKSLLRWDFQAWDMPALLDPRVSGKHGIIAAGHRGVNMFVAQPYKLLETTEQLVYDAVFKRKDQFGGNPIVPLIRLITYTGLIGATGATYGVDLIKHLMHLPWTTHDIAGEFTFTAPPIASLMTDISREGLGKGLEKQFNYLGAPQKMFGEKYPEWKYGSRAAYLMGVPKWGWEKEAANKQAWRELMELKRGGLKKPPSNFQKLKDLIGGD